MCISDRRYTVTARVNDGNGTITPVSKTVDAGDDVVFTITAYGGYALDYITCLLYTSQSTVFWSLPDGGISRRVRSL